MRPWVHPFLENFEGVMAGVSLQHACQIWSP